MKEIIIGKQVWMAENLDLKEFRDGSPIKEIGWDDKEEWVEAAYSGVPAFCYQFDDKNLGLIYNVHAILSKKKLAPEGWKIPNNSDWQKMMKSLGVKPQKMVKTSGQLQLPEEERMDYRLMTNDDWNYDIIRAEGIANKLKVKEGWAKDNGGGSNELGFNGIPYTFRMFNGGKSAKGIRAAWWSSSGAKDKYGLRFIAKLDNEGVIEPENNNFDLEEYNCAYGFAVRCVKSLSNNE